MKKLILYLYLILPVYVNSQSIDIYSKWAAKLDDNTQLILDLSSRSTMGLTRISSMGNQKFKIDSFGYRRVFNTAYMDLDSTVIWWSGSLAQIHEKIETTVYNGLIEVTEKNYRGIPQKISFSGEVPELSIYMNYDDTIELRRMVLTGENQIEYNYPTYYGGEISYLKYKGDHSGFSMGLRDIGMQYETFDIKNSILKKLNEILTDTINTIRMKKDVEPLKIINALNEASSNSITEWLKEAKRLHQLNIFKQEVDSSIGNYFNGRSLRDDFSFLHYPFRCGMNALAIRMMDINISNKNQFNHYIDANAKKISQVLFAELMENKGEFQNIFNQGYSTMGSSLLAVEAKKNDFYFDESGVKVDLKNNRDKYYYLMFVQTFSIYDEP